MNPLHKLEQFGQSFWMDYISRRTIESGELARLVEEDGLRGLTSNPTIFEQAIGGSPDYDEQLRELLKADPEMPVDRLFQKLAVRDIQMTADILRRVYDETDGGDGFVSLEVSPHLANDTGGTGEQVRHLWAEVDRPNLMIKVPATPAGIPAIETLIGEGININVTLMFSVGHYDAVSAAYLKGLERCPEPRRTASVASFFVSRVDSKVDARLKEIGSEKALKLRGTIGVANAKVAYQRFREVFYGAGFAPWREKGARVQRVLWGSTSTKNPDYSDVLYVEELIGPDTVNTMPPETIDAFRDHGKVRASLEEGVELARAQLQELGEVGIDLDAVTEELQEEGVKKFADSYDSLIRTLEEKRNQVLEQVQAAG